MNGGASSRLSSTIGGTQGVSAGAGMGSLIKKLFPATGAAATTELKSWAEYRHPQFRRGRRDLLVGVKRQDSGHRKRKRGMLLWRAGYRQHVDGKERLKTEIDEMCS